jgi:hypothetical protein
VNHQQSYKEDILEAIQLVKEEVGFCKLKTARHINSVKRNPVPQTTLINRIQSDESESQPSLGWLQENKYI